MGIWNMQTCTHEPDSRKPVEAKNHELSLPRLKYSTSFVKTCDAMRGYIAVYMGQLGVATIVEESAGQMTTL
jgi:hypothetical protein